MPSTLLNLCPADRSLRQSGTVWILCPDWWVKSRLWPKIRIPGPHQVLTVLVSPASLHSRLTLTLPAWFFRLQKFGELSVPTSMNAPLLKLISINIWCLPLIVIFQKFCSQLHLNKMPSTSGADISHKELVTLLWCVLAEDQPSLQPRSLMTATQSNAPPFWPKEKNLTQEDKKRKGGSQVWETAWFRVGIYWLKSMNEWMN